MCEYGITLIFVCMLSFFFYLSFLSLLYYVPPIDLMFVYIYFNIYFSVRMSIMDSLMQSSMSLALIHTTRLDNAGIRQLSPPAVPNLY